ncbi:MAG TPA: NUDIX domain-containing protein [Polyangiaceae bacterium]|nr:NUDIX domain-containing protein [Polyangiaceae bacterium]HMR73505.1 NUDIX domain-containing protein [Polyangiaceae bacterium]
MSDRTQNIPKPPYVRLETVEDRSPADTGGFLRLLRRRYLAHYPDGTISAPFNYDEVDRPAIDAVVVLAYFQAPGGGLRVYLRSAVRPAVVMRDRKRSPLTESESLGCAWELPAGLVETSEQSEAGLRLAAKRELMEELGFEVAETDLIPLGPSTFPAPGICAERHFFYQVRVDPDAREEPANDGSALEHGGAVVHVALEAALQACRAGQLEDAKTELALRRFAEQSA